MILLATFIGACSQEAQRPTIELSVSPHVLRLCDPPAEITVDWSVEHAGIEAVNLFVREFGSQPKLWHHGLSTGVATTGPWATEGFTVFLKSLDGRVLARATLGAEPC